MKKLVTTLALALVLVGCGSSGGDKVTTTTKGPPSTTSRPTPTSTGKSIEKVTTSAVDSPTTTQEAPELESAVRAYTAAFLGGDDAGAYDLLSDRCHGEMAQANFKDIVDQAANLYGDATITSYNEKLNGNAATATYELSDPTLNQTNERWILENGAWHNDEC